MGGLNIGFGNNELMGEPDLQVVLMQRYSLFSGLIRIELSAVGFVLQVNVMTCVERLVEVPQRRVLVHTGARDNSFTPGACLAVKLRTSKIVTSHIDYEPAL